MTVPERYANLVTTYSKVVVAVLLVATLLVGSAATSVDGGLELAEFGSDSTEAQKLDYLTANFSTEGENTTAVQVVVRDGEALSQDSLLAGLRFQRALREDPTVNATLAERQPTVGISNLVALAAIRSDEGGNGPPGSGDSGPPGTVPGIDAQIAQLQSMSEENVAATVSRVLDPSTPVAGGQDPYAFLPRDYETESGTAEARMTIVFQEAPESEELPAAVEEGQVAISSLVDSELPGDSFAFGQGIVQSRSTEATGQSFAIISPVALLLVFGVLFVAYRDLLDVLLGFLGIVLVLVWMAGFMGWAGIGVTQILIAVPFLLIGLSIDYALHVVMRYREAQDGERSPREAMGIGLAGVTVALGATTFTTAVGFFSNLVSPIGSIQEFGLVSGFGIVSAFVVFGALLPALKVELEGVLQWVGLSREKRAFGTAGPVKRLLGVGASGARRVPVAIVVVALLVSAGGGYAATDIDTSLNQIDFLPRDSPDWMDNLPEPFRPDDFQLREQAVYVSENFLQSNDRSRVELLVEGPVTDPTTLERIDAGREAVGNTGTAVQLANGEPRVTDPVTLIESLVATDAGNVPEVVEDNDPNEDGIPEQNLAAVYDAVYEAAPDRAESVIYRDGDRYRALRVSAAVKGTADTGEITTEMRSVAVTMESDTDLDVTATGQPIVTELVQKGLLRTLVETFLITLGVILTFLTAIFYRRHGTLSLGAVTLVPVVFALSWILGTMYLLGIPFNTETAIIASIAIGLGVDYAIHVSERFVEEAKGAASTHDALVSTVSGTGGALLASAATTASGFGVLTLALVPSLRRFGLVTGTTIVFAFVASVYVLPSLLALWAERAPSMESAFESDPEVAETTDAAGSD
jgi:predicted RND superfamily exporter protein